MQKKLNFILTLSVLSGFSYGLSNFNEVKAEESHDGQIVPDQTSAYLRTGIRDDARPTAVPPSVPWYSHSL